MGTLASLLTLEFLLRLPQVTLGRIFQMLNGLWNAIDSHTWLHNFNTILWYCITASLFDHIPHYFCLRGSCDLLAWLRMRLWLEVASRLRSNAFPVITIDIFCDSGPWLPMLFCMDSTRQAYGLPPGWFNFSPQRGPGYYMDGLFLWQGLYERITEFWNLRLLENPTNFFEGTYD